MTCDMKHQQTPATWFETTLLLGMPIVAFLILCAVIYYYYC